MSTGRRQSERALIEAKERPADPTTASGLAERGQLLRKLLLDTALINTADYEAAFLAAVPVNPPQRLERLAGRCLFRLVEKTADGGIGSRGVLPAVSRVLGQPLEELLAVALRHEAPTLPHDLQVPAPEAALSARADGAACICESDFFTVFFAWSAGRCRCLRRWRRGRTASRPTLRRGGRALRR